MLSMSDRTGAVSRSGQAEPVAVLGHVLYVVARFAVGLELSSIHGGFQRPLDFADELRRRYT